MRTLFSKLLMGFALLLAYPSFAATPSKGVPAIPDYSELPLEQTLMLPEVDAKGHKYVREYMLREARALQKMGFKVETMRKGEVLVVTIPADELFAANDTVLMISGANQKLIKFLPYFRQRDRFRVILAMHSDDTGSEGYLNGLTEKRIMALYDYFDRNATQTEHLQGYPMGPSTPLLENNSASNRRRNRRLEIYIVPGDLLVVEGHNKSK